MIRVNARRTIMDASRRTGTSAACKVEITARLLRPLWAQPARSAPKQSSPAGDRRLGPSERNFPIRISAAPPWRMQLPVSASASAPAPPPAARVRRDGWTADRQMAFIRVLFAGGSVTRAAAAAGMSRESAYRLRARPGHAAFARAWDCAVAGKGHSSAAESNAPHRRGAPHSPRESHEGHGGKGFPQHGQVGQFEKVARG